ncbi:hypothetical protein [Streptomyces sp. B29(2018)]|uniref:hypothetical protein n=1 Tax=Streptomyces sp. B29(2018) TaxID=2485016 RepID=UPI000FD65AFB|nr:hypothetical protein [Streptomyces sp. B29(2018)]
MNVDLKVDGLFLLVGGIAAVGTYGVLSGKLGKMLNKVNPASSDNLAYQGAASLGDAVGIPDTDSRGVYLDDYIFAAIDQVNPFNESDAYSDYVIWGKPL